MEKVLIHCPINISRALSNRISDFIQTAYADENAVFEVYNEPHRLGKEDTLIKSIQTGNPPALYLGQAMDFGLFSIAEVEASFEPLYDLPLAENLQGLGFRPELNYFHPFTIIPFGTIYNKKLVGEKHPLSWKDFQAPVYAGKIRLPDRERTISRVLCGLMQILYPTTHSKFMQNCVFAASPIEVVQAVDQGEYPFGMVNIAFSRFSRQKNTGILWMEEGAFCMPQVVAVGKGKRALADKLLNFIFSSSLQDFLSIQGFVPAVSGAIPAVLEKADFQLIWKGWEAFLCATKQ